jgi:hypothetical protein
MKMHPRRTQSGAALAVAIILLLLLSVVTFFAVRLAMAEQRIATSDVRAKVVHRVAEAGIEQAVEFVRLRQETLLPKEGETPNSAFWVPCAVDDREFPCGAIEPHLASSTLRGMHYAYYNSAAAGAVEQRSLPMSSSFNTVGNFPVTYNVGAVLCLLDKTNVSGGTSVCTPTVDESDTLALTLVSSGGITSEAARATISVAMSRYKIIDANPNIPPLVSSSIIEGLGNATIVATPSGGQSRFGQSNHPISVWTRSTLGPVGGTSSGSFQTCGLHSFMSSHSSATYYNGDIGKPICDDCVCSATLEEPLLSKNGVEGLDMLDRDPTDTGVLKPTDPVLSPTYEFPCDLFSFVFGVQARSNEVSTDSYNDDPPLCETHVDANANGVPDVVEYLTTNFEVIPDCSNLEALAAGEGGFFWAQNNCSLQGGQVIGSPANPVVLVVDSVGNNKGLKINGATVYGLIFVRDPATTYDPSNGGAGSAVYEPGGGTGIVYGSVVIEGPGKLNGGLKIVSSPGIISTILESPKNIKLAKVPDSWNDGLSY